ncbi:unnamed protein product [Calicophoron daubneyi]|uniref:Uncharacterized protein n=1 Tax=Calicophoron daubneyi TaxID=300641 RepID=A0AAV2TBQ6_CALDB
MREEFLSKSAGMKSDCRIISATSFLQFRDATDIQDFYQTTLLDPQKDNDEKAAAALDVALRWENISSPSLVASTIDLRRPNSGNEQVPSFDRARSLYQLNAISLGECGAIKSSKHPRHPMRARLRQDLKVVDQSSSTLSFSMQNYSPSNTSLNNEPGMITKLQHSAQLSSEPDYGHAKDKIEQRLTSGPNRPVVKPRQRRMKKPKSMANYGLNADWTGLDENESPVPASLPQDEYSTTEPYVDEQWSNIVGNMPITTEVIIDKSSQGFGFSIAGGRDDEGDGVSLDTDILVTRVNPDGAAGKDGGLHVGDRIVSVNGISLLGVSHEEAVRALQLAGTQLRMVVERKQVPPLAESEYSTSQLPYSLTETRSNQSASSQTGTSRPRIAESGTSTGSGAASLTSAGLTNNSIMSGSAFEPSSNKKHTSDSVTLQSTVTGRQIHSEPAATSQRDAVAVEQRPSSLNINTHRTADVGTQEPAEGTLSISSNKRAIKSIISSGFPAFSWCAGLHKTTGCSAILSGHRSLPGSHGSSRRTPSGSNGSQSKHYTLQSKSSSSRPVPAPQPGPVVVEVTLSRGTRSGLGFSIAGGLGNETIDGDSGIFITKLTPGGIAETDGRVSIGDRIVQVNETSVVGATHESAVKALKQAGDEVRLIVVKQAIPSTRLIWPSGKKEDLPGSPPTHRNEGNVESQPSSGTKKDEERPGSVTNSNSNHLETISISTDTNVSVRDAAEASKLANMGRELLESQMAGLIDYAVASSMSELISKWPNARLVTLYRGGRHDNESQKQLGGGHAVTEHSRSASSGGGNLGLNIVGGDGSDATYVSQVQPNKPAGRSKRVFVGDRVLAVNGIDVTRYGHEQAAAALRNAPDRVDLVLVHCPEEYAEFEKCYSRQLKAVGHKLSNKATKEMTVDMDRKGSNLRGNRTGGKHAGDRMTSSVSSLDQANQTRLRKSADPELYLRSQVDYDPNLDDPTSMPKRAFNIRSGDVFRVLNWNDSQWWKAQRLNSNSHELTGLVGYIPSQARLEKCERLRTEKNHFYSRIRHSREDTSTGFSVSPSPQSVKYHRDPSTGLAVSVTSLTNSVTRRSGAMEQEGNTKLEQKEQFVLSYIDVAPVQLSFMRPVVILGFMKDRIADELLSQHPDRFGTAVPYTTRSARPNEVDGREYHFDTRREAMVEDIAAQRYLEAGEFNGNLYGTHLESVFEIAELGMHCLLDVGGPALRRLEAAGLPSIALLILPKSFPERASLTSSSGKSSEHLSRSPTNAPDYSDPAAFLHIQSKLVRLVRNFSVYLTAVITTDDFRVAYSRVKELIFNNSGPMVWLNAPQRLC